MCVQNWYRAKSEKNLDFSNSVLIAWVKGLFQTTNGLFYITLWPEIIHTCNVL